MLNLSLPTRRLNQAAFLGLLFGGWVQGAEFDLTAAVKAARPGDVVLIPAGTYACAGLELVTGVTLKGAGYQTTILDARHTTNGVIVSGKGSAISDLSITDASESGILAQGATELTIARVAVRNCLSGVLSTGSHGVRLENAILSNNRRGAVLTGSSDATVVNCTIANNQVLAVSVSGGQHVTIFNNIFTGSPTGVWIAPETTKLVLDANLYGTNIIGTRSGDTSRASLFGWRRLTGYDTHSIDLGVTFANPIAGDFHPISHVAWNPTLATTSEWGLAEMNGIRAPISDIDGNVRKGGVDIGAYESAFPSPRQPDGAFTVADGATLKSAALYDAAGRMLTELFQNLPLPAGQQPFYFPSRDQSNLIIAPGDYEFRLVESNLVNRYRGLAGNFSKSSNLADNCSWPEEMIAFDQQDQVYVLQNSFENGQGVRAFDATYQQPRWMMPGGGSTVGWAVDAQWLYYLQARGGGRFVLRKIALSTGAMGDVAGGGGLDLAAPFSSRLNGMALLGSDLFLSDPATGIIYKGAATNPVFVPLATIPGATSVTADERNKHLWVIADGGAITALDPATGKTLGRYIAIPGVGAINARNGLLAALSTTTGKIHILDVTDPAAVKPVRTIGTGDGPGGLQQPDRFWFQQSTLQPIGPMKYSVSINGHGDVAVVDGPRVSFWAADGRLRKQGLGMWGQHLYAARWAENEDIKLFNVSADYAIAMDCRNGTWKPDGAWEKPNYQYDERIARHFFAIGKQHFGLLHVTLGDPTRSGSKQVEINGFDKAKTGFPGYLFVRLDEQRMVPVLLTYNHPTRGTQVLCHDLNHDDVIDGEEGLVEQRRMDGQALMIPNARYDALPWTASGDLLFAGASAEKNCGQIVKLKGLDPSGTWPMYAWDAAIPLPATNATGGQPDLLSPYDFTTVERLTNTFQIAPFANGGYAQSAILKSSGGTGLANGAGTDVAGFGPNGAFRWLYKLAHREGSEGVQSLPTLGLSFAMTSKECDYHVIDEDGLGLGALSIPEESHWVGMWSDHAQQQVVWIGNDGSANYVLGDYALNGYHWFAIDHLDQVRRTRKQLTLSAEKSADLAKLTKLPLSVKTTPPPTDIRVPHVAAPMKMDGDVTKWRSAGIPPAIMITPETGTGISGPQDCCAVMRLAWEGSNLYVQSIVFDDRISFHQPLAQMYQQDGIELAINGFMEGFKFNVARTTDHGPTLFRNRFSAPAFDKLLSSEAAPRSIVVYPDSQKLEERHLLESLYGIDLAKSPAIVTEFCLPLNGKVALEGDPGQIPSMKSGSQFYLGVMINDNDIIGGDVQKYLVWPATYGTFGMKTQGARATLE